MILPDLSPHKHRDTIRRLGVAKCARALGITTSYLYGVINGVHDGSMPLQQDIENLIVELQKPDHTTIIDNVENV